MKVFKLWSAVAAAALLLIVSVTASAQPALANVSKSRIPSVDGRGTAADGYDVVAYFDYGEVTLGTPDFRLDHNGWRYNFASKVTMKKFMGDPEQYLPQYGGYCALSLAIKGGEFEGRQPGLYKADATVYKIVNGHLYFFTNQKALEIWNENEAAYMAQADANWQAVLEYKKKK